MIPLWIRRLSAKYRLREAQERTAKAAEEATQRIEAAGARLDEHIVRSRAK